MSTSLPISPGAAPVTGLLALSKKHGWRTFWLGVAAIPAGVVVFVVCFTFVFGLVMGPILVIAGLVMIPLGLLQVMDPTRQKSIKVLGRDAAERVSVLGQIEGELAGAVGYQLALAGKTTLSVTTNWIVFHGAELVIVHRSQMLWAYSKVTRSRSGRRFSVCLKTRQLRTEEITVQEAEQPKILGILGHAVPRALIGFTPELGRLSYAQLAAQVDSRPA